MNKHNRRLLLGKLAGTSNIIGPFLDPSDVRRVDEKLKWKFIFNLNKDCFQISGGPSGIGTRYCKGSRVYNILMKPRMIRLWDREHKYRNFKSLNENLFKDNLEERTSSLDVLMFGDSQMGGDIGELLQRKFGGVKVYVNGSSPFQWAKGGKYFYKIKDHLEKLPENIYISMGGNSPNGTGSLIETINDISEFSKITWITPPPAAQDGYKYKFVDYQVKRSIFT